MSGRDPNAWRNVPMAAVFEADYDAWIKSLSKKARAAEPVMRWQDLGPYSHCAYGLHEHLASTYCFLTSKKKGPTELPDNCTPEGFYLEAVATRRQQVGLDAPPPMVKTSKKATAAPPVEVTPFVPTAFERLSPFSRFLYRRMADRVAVAAGFTTATSRASTLDDGLGDDLSVDDDGLGVDDGLGGADVPDDLDDGLGGAVAASDDGLGDELGDGL